MNRFDDWIDRATRKIAQRSSRRRFLARFGSALVAATTFPVLPVGRSHAAGPQAAEQGDPLACDYWRHCAIDGYLCGCCGGSVNSCPPGTEISPVSWIGTCTNPVDGRDYVISYNDCCGKSGCGRCFCNTNEGDKPIYMPAKSNDINWCLGTSTNAYHCSTAVVIGRASAQS